MKSIIFFIAIFFALTTSAQDCYVSFTGSGASLAVDRVKVENLTAGTSVTLRKYDILHLTETVEIPSNNNHSSELKIYPNPMTQYSTLEFHPETSGEATISIIEITGKQIFKYESFLSNSHQEFHISGLNNGLYLIIISGKFYQYAGKLLCIGKANGRIEIENVNNNIQSTNMKESGIDYKGAKGIIDMEYKTGEWLKFTGTSGIYSSVITARPSSNRLIIFNFVSCTDGDSNNYPVVEIGTQTWMAENLKTTKYNDGTAIPNVTDGSEWAVLTTPAYCWYNNNIVNKDIYGALYNWYVVKTGSLCPSGWHVPTDAEWHQLVLSLDPNAVLADAESEIAGSKLKEEGTTRWSSPNAGTTNESGFTALPGGNRRYDGLFFGPTGNGTWRTASEYDATHVWYRYMFYYSSCVYRKATNMQAGYSVRCVKD